MRCEGLKGGSGFRVLGFVPRAANGNRDSSCWKVQHGFAFAIRCEPAVFIGLIINRDGRGIGPVRCKVFDGDGIQFFSGGRYGVRYLYADTSSFDHGFFSGDRPASVDAAVFNGSFRVLIRGPDLAVRRQGLVVGKMQYYGTFSGGIDRRLTFRKFYLSFDFQGYLPVSVYPDGRVRFQGEVFEGNGAFPVRHDGNSVLVRASGEGELPLPSCHIFRPAVIYDHVVRGRVV